MDFLENEKLCVCVTWYISAISQSSQELTIKEGGGAEAFSPRTRE